VNDYESRSLQDRSFLWAISLSVLWHLFWFFSLSITMGDHKKPRVKSKLVSIGTVLDDSFFKTIVENRPQLSEAFYRAHSDLSPKLEPAPKMMEPYAAGDVVSVPFSRKFSDSLKEIIGGEKFSPDFDFLPSLSGAGRNILETDADSCENDKDPNCPEKGRG
jgi:hypothetical protein